MSAKQPVQWPLTLKAVNDLEKDLSCSKCCKLVSSPRTFKNCLHFFCQACIGKCSSCPECFVPSSAKDIYYDKFIENLAMYVMNLEKSLRCLQVESKVDTGVSNSMESFSGVKRKVRESVGKEKTSNFSPEELNHAPQKEKETEGDVEAVRGSKRKLGRRRSLSSKKCSLESPMSLSIFRSPCNSLTNTSDSSVENHKPATSSSSDMKAPLSSGLNLSMTSSEDKVPSAKIARRTKSLSREREVKMEETLNPELVTPVKNTKGKRPGESLIKNISDTIKKAANKRNAKGETPLQVACKKGNFKQVQSLIADAANPNVKDNFGWTPLHEAIHYNHIEIAKELIEKGGASVNTPGGENCTPLHKAVAMNVLEGIKLLLKYGANPNLVDIYGNIPLDYSQSDEVTRMLEKHSADFTKSSVLDPLSEEPEVDEERVVLFGDGLSKNNLKLLGNLSSLIPGSRVSHSFTSEVTHVVVNEEHGVCLASVNVLSGILTGKHFVSVEWVQYSIKMKSIKHQHCPAVKSTKTYPFANGIQRARTCLRKQLPSIFSGMHFAISSVCRNLKYDDLKRDDIANLVAMGGGKYHSREPDPEAIPVHEKTVPFYANNFVKELTGLDKDHPLKNCSHVILYQEDDPKNLTQRGGDPSFIKYNMVHFKSLPMTWFVGCVESFTLLDPSPFL